MPKSISRALVGSGTVCQLPDDCVAEAIVSSKGRLRWADFKPYAKTTDRFVAVGRRQKGRKGRRYGEEGGAH